MSLRTLTEQQIKHWKKYRDKWKNTDPRQLDDHTLMAIAADVRADAQLAARSPDHIPPGMLRECIETDPYTNRKTVKFYGAGPHFDAYGNTDNIVTQVTIKSMQRSYLYRNWFGVLEGQV